MVNKCNGIKQLKLIPRIRPIEINQKAKKFFNGCHIPLALPLPPPREVLRLTEGGVGNLVELVFNFLDSNLNAAPVILRYY